MIKSIKIGPQTFSVVKRSNNEDGMLNDGAYGYTLESGNLIVINSEIGNGKQKVTLLHEILHAIRMNAEGMPKPSKDDDFESWEHYFIGLYESNLLAVLKDNPKLVEWLTNEQPKTSNK
jgi:Mlc titration factor MtfA (ptsG expression regulator)